MVVALIHASKRFVPLAARLKVNRKEKQEVVGLHAFDRWSMVSIEPAYCADWFLTSGTASSPGGRKALLNLPA